MGLSVHIPSDEVVAFGEGSSAGADRRVELPPVGPPSA